jgi:hypothetical protein
MALMDSPLFLGFGTLEDLVDQDLVDRTVYVMAISERHTIPNSSMGTAHKLMRVQGLLPTRVVGYCQISLGYVEEINGSPLESNRALAAARRVESARQVVERWLAARGLRVVNATFAAPRDFKLLDGQANFLDYDRETDTFHSAEGPTP